MGTSQSSSVLELGGRDSGGCGLDRILLSELAGGKGSRTTTGTSTIRKVRRDALPTTESVLIRRRRCAMMKVITAHIAIPAIIGNVYRYLGTAE